MIVSVSDPSFLAEVSLVLDADTVMFPSLGPLRLMVLIALVVSSQL